MSNRHRSLLPVLRSRDEEPEVKLLPLPLVVARGARGNGGTLAVRCGAQGGHASLACLLGSTALG